jgi:peptide/nickel transport system permease protein/oligopeptide transport system permease protein
MGRYLIRRLLQAIPVLLGVTIIMHYLVFQLPGDPLQALAGDKRVDPTVAAVLRERYHLNDPWIVQYWNYLSNALTGDFGSTYTGREVADIIANRFPVTLKLALTAFGIEAVIGIVAGVFSALRKGGFVDNLTLVSTLFLISLPTFVSGSVLQLLLGVEWPILPIAGTDDGWPMSYIMPGFVLASISMAYISRLTRTSMMEVMKADYVRTAIAKGLTRRRVIGRHALRNALIPIITFLGVDLGFLMGGAIITEAVFNLPGIGGQLAESLHLREQPVVVGLITLLVLIFLAANIIVDMLYAVLDPRIRYE